MAFMPAIRKTSISSRPLNNEAMIVARELDIRTVDTISVKIYHSGGGKADDAKLFEQIQAIRDGGGFGSIIGRNSFQRPLNDAVKLLHSIMDVYKG